MTTMPLPTIDLAEIDWAPQTVSADTPHGRLTSTIQFCGVTMLVDAIAVETSAGLQEALDAELDDTLGLYHSATAADGPFATVTITTEHPTLGEITHDYAICITPHS